MPEDLEQTREYYDKFSKSYEDKRYKGYHLLIDELEFDCIKNYIKDKKVLEAGCGTGLILQRISKLASEHHGIDISEGMLLLAKEKGLNVKQASVTEMPFEDNYFDVVCSFKVLPHVENIRQAIKEMNRVTKPGGVLILEFYNTMSLRYLIKKIKTPSKTSEKFTDEDVYTRYDNLTSIQSYLTSDLKIEKVQGVRIITPVARVYDLPVISDLYSFLEKLFRDSLISCYGGFLVVTMRKSDV